MFTDFINSENRNRDGSSAQRILPAYQSRTMPSYFLLPIQVRLPVILEVLYKRQNNLCNNYTALFSKTPDTVC